MADTTASPAPVTATPTPEGTTAGAPTPEAAAPGADAAAKSESVARALQAIAKREREARRIQEEATKVSSRWTPLEEAARTGDIQGLIRAAGQIAGLSPETVMDAIVSSIAEEGREKTPDELVAAKVAEALGARDKEAAERAAKERETSLSETRTKYLSHVEQTAQTQSQAYPLIAEMGSDAASEVLALVEKWHAESGEFLPTDRAMKLVEDAYQEKARRMAARLGLASAAPAPQPGSAAPSSLSNKQTGGVPAVTVDGDVGSLSDSQRIRRAMTRIGVRA